jgi:hypothetical protein
MVRATPRPYLQPRRGIVFDFGGTLLDVSEATVHSFNAVLTGHDLGAVDPRTLAGMIGRTWCWLAQTTSWPTCESWRGSSGNTDSRRCIFLADLVLPA